MEIDNFVKTISSPETGKIYFAPMVNFITGQVYEEDSIEIFSEDIIPFIQLRSLIIGFLEEFPEYKRSQYVPTNNQKFDFAKNIAYFEDLTDKKMNQLFKFSNFKMKLISIELFSKIIGCGSCEIIKHFIDHCDNINYVFKHTGWSLLNYMCRDLSRNYPDLVAYMIKKGADITHLCEYDHWLPLQQIMHNAQSKKLIKYAIDKHFEAGLDLNIKTRRGDILLIYIIDKQPKKIIMYSLRKMAEYNKKIGYHDILVEKLLKMFNESVLEKMLGYVNKINA